MSNNPIQIFPLTLIRAGGLPLAAWAPLSRGMPDWMALQKDGQEAAQNLLQAFDEALSFLPPSELRTLVYNARKRFFQQRKMPGARVMAVIQEDASLHLIQKAIEGWEKYQQEIKAAERQFEKGLSDNYKVLQYCPVFGDETLQKALLFASHTLLASLPDFMQKQVGDFNKKDRQTAFSLLQYLTRSVFKTAPLGRFTTVQVRKLSSFHEVEEGVGEWHQSKFLVSPNVAFLPAIYDVLLGDPAFYQSLRLTLNPCIAPLPPFGNASIAAVSWLYFDGEHEAFQQIGPDPVAELVLKVLLHHNRSIPFVELMGILGHAVAANEMQLKELLFKLVDIGLLEWQWPEKGLSSNWCSGLYNYLGYLPASPVLTEAAYLLQWMRTAARTMPFHTLTEARDLQRETLKELSIFFKKYGVEAPPIPPEQLFFEEVAAELTLDLSPGIIETLVDQLAECWHRKELPALSPFRARLMAFGKDFLAPGDRVGFLEFSRAFLESGHGNTPANNSVLKCPPKCVEPAKHKIGALLQIFQENGQYKAVVNAMYSGGGKLFARWHPLFSSDVLDQLREWQKVDGIVAAFPWQGWSNANFQPAISGLSVMVPDGRTGDHFGGRTVLLGDIMVQKGGDAALQLIDRASGHSIMFNDLGLESPETRPPVMQVLWHLGVPAVSSEYLLPSGAMKWEPFGEIYHRRRITNKSLILNRAAWKLPAEVCAKLFLRESTQAERIGSVIMAMKDWGIPQQFFGQFITKRERPQFYDMESPVSMLLLEKNVRAGKGELLLTEMLPVPEQWLGPRATEFVVEFSLVGQ